MKMIIVIAATLVMLGWTGLASANDDQGDRVMRISGGRGHTTAVWETQKSEQPHALTGNERPEKIDRTGVATRGRAGYASLPGQR